MTTVEIGLLSATIGGMSGIFSQIIAKALQDKSDDKKTIRNILSEERRLAYLIRQNFHSLNANILDKHYWSQSIEFENEIKRKELIQDRILDADRTHNILFEKHSDLIGDYLKNINHFTLLLNCSDKLDKVLSKIVSDRFLLREEMKQHTSYSDLLKEYEDTHKLLRDKADQDNKKFDNVCLIVREINKNRELD